MNIYLFLQYRLCKMDKLFQYGAARINGVDLAFRRYLYDKIDWNARLIAITGARGVGKTTLILQYIREQLWAQPDEVLYASLDDLYFSQTTLVDFADHFVKRGGKYLFLDEVHKYKNWSQEIKSIYDYFPGLKLVITGSSALDIQKGTSDLSRRVLLYRLNGLSFREYIQLNYKLHFPVLTLEQILTNPSGHIKNILQEIKPIKLFEEYLKYGFYPFFVEDEKNFHIRLRQTVNHVLEVDLPAAEHIDFSAIHAMRTLLAIISEVVPFKPNILKLAQQVGVSRETLLKYLFLLERADLLLLLPGSAQGTARLNKPEKVYLNNANLMFALTKTMVNAGTLRETFILNQLGLDHKVAQAEKGDFLVDSKFTVEVGGQRKKSKQIANIENAFIAADNVEFAHQNKIPLWLFGFLY